MNTISKKLFATLLFFVAVTALISSCAKDDDTTTTKTPEQVIAGTWLSEGADVAPILLGAPLKTKKITATFNSNSTYSVVATDSSNANTTYEGTFDADTTNVSGIYKITTTTSKVNGVAYVIESKGIFRIDEAAIPDYMTYEVAQTTPVIAGVTPPTAQAGFGSTSGSAFGTLNVQHFKKQ